MCRRVFRIDADSLAERIDGPVLAGFGGDRVEGDAVLIRGIGVEVPAWRPLALDDRARCDEKPGLQRRRDRLRDRILQREQVLVRFVVMLRP